MAACLYESVVLSLQEDAHSRWIEEARQVAVRLARERGEVTIDDVREVLPPPVCVDPRINGVVFRPSKYWRCVGYRKSAREENHNRPIGIWQYIGP